MLRLTQSSQSSRKITSFLQSKQINAQPPTSEQRAFKILKVNSTLIFYAWNRFKFSSLSPWWNLLLPQPGIAFVYLLQYDILARATVAKLCNIYNIYLFSPLSFSLNFKFSLSLSTRAKLLLVFFLQPGCLCLFELYTFVVLCTLKTFILCFSSTQYFTTKNRCAFVLTLFFPLFRTVHHLNRKFFFSMFAKLIFNIALNSKKARNIWKKKRKASVMVAWVKGRREDEEKIAIESEKTNVMLVQSQYYWFISSGFRCNIFF